MDSLDGTMKSEVSTLPYFDEAYLQPWRFAAWGIQFREAVATGGQSFLEIGNGPGILAYALRKAGKAVVTVDPEPSLGPDIMAALPQLPLDSESVDAVLCFEVLEHIPFDMFAESVREMSRVSRRWVLFSVPNRIPVLRFMIDGPRLHFSRGWPWRRRASSDPLAEGHYWEIGAGVTAEDIRQRMGKNGLTICRSFRPWVCLYHHFFVCEKCE